MLTFTAFRSGPSPAIQDLESRYNRSSEANFDASTSTTALSIPNKVDSLAPKLNVIRVTELEPEENFLSPDTLRKRSPKKRGSHGRKNVVQLKYDLQGKSFPSFTALFAIITIPPWVSRKDQSCNRRDLVGENLTVEANLDHNNVSEKECHISFEGSPLDLLLNPPTIQEIDELSSNENIQALESSHQLKSVPETNKLTTSLQNNSNSDSLPLSLVSTNKFLCTSTSLRIRSRRTPSYSMHESVNENHPLCATDSISSDSKSDNLPASQNNNTISYISNELPIQHKSSSPSTSMHNRSSLHVVKSAAKSLSLLVPPRLVKSRSCRTKTTTTDSNTLFSNDCKLLRLEDVPTPILRQYLNPVTNAPIEAHNPISVSQKIRHRECLASIQMQTYKISSSRKRPVNILISRRTQPIEDEKEEISTKKGPDPIVRQRDMRENGDFMRIAVMEMLMRKRGKLDDQRPGKARWALPPRTLSNKPYEITANGVPVRWIPQTV